MEPPQLRRIVMPVVTLKKENSTHSTLKCYWNPCVLRLWIIFISMFFFVFLYFLNFLSMHFLFFFFEYAFSSKNYRRKTAMFSKYLLLKRACGILCGERWTGRHSPAHKAPVSQPSPPPSGETGQRPRPLQRLLKFSLQKKLLDICLNNDFLEMIPEAQALKAKVNRDCIRTYTLPDIVLLFSSLLFFFFKFIWLHQILVVACRLSCPVVCGILVPWPGIEPASPAVEGVLLETGSPGMPLSSFLMSVCVLSPQTLLKVEGGVWSRRVPHSA